MPNRCIHLISCVHLTPTLGIISNTVNMEGQFLNSYKNYVLVPTKKTKEV